MKHGPLTKQMTLQEKLAALHYWRMECPESLDVLCPWAADEIERLRAENIGLYERTGALVSREVCTRAHDHADSCGYCQRDRLLNAMENAIQTYSVEPAEHP
jgi:hypothetical protein